MATAIVNGVVPAVHDYAFAENAVAAVDDVYGRTVVVEIGRPGRHRPLGRGRPSYLRGLAHVPSAAGLGRGGVRLIRHGTLVHEVGRVQLEFLFALLVLLPGPSLGGLLGAVLARRRRLHTLGTRAVPVLAVPLVLLPHLAEPVVLAVGAQPLLLLDGLLRRLHHRRRGSDHLNVLLLLLLLLLLMMVVMMMSAGWHFGVRI